MFSPCLLLRISAHAAYVVGWDARYERDRNPAQGPHVAIQTVVASWDEKLIRSLPLEQELDRGGQIYFVK